MRKKYQPRPKRECGGNAVIVISCLSRGACSFIDCLTQSRAEAVALNEEAAARRRADAVAEIDAAAPYRPPRRSKKKARKTKNGVKCKKTSL